MNSQGKITIAPEYGDAGPFVEGLAVVLKGEKYGVINKKNEPVIDFIYDEISTFNNTSFTKVELRNVESKNFD
jgi:hypothetical protein